MPLLILPAAAVPSSAAGPCPGWPELTKQWGPGVRPPPEETANSSTVMKQAGADDNPLQANPKVSASSRQQLVQEPNPRERAVLRYCTAKQDA